MNYPTRPIRLVAAGPGGSHDFAARILAPVLAEALGQKVEIDYKPSGFVPGETVARAAPDGHTLLVSGRALWLMAMVAEKPPFDVLEDFAPIAQTTRGPEVLVVHPDMPVRTAGELIALAKGKPGQLTYGSGGDGVNNHLASELFKSMAGVDIRRVRFDNSAMRMAALIAGDIDMHFTGLCSAAPAIKDGKARPLGLTTLNRSALAPEVPTIAESGLPGYENITIGALFAPAGTPSDIVQCLNGAVARYLKSGAAAEKFSQDGYEAVGGTPQELGDTIRSDVQRIGKVIAGLGIKGGQAE